MIILDKKNLGAVRLIRVFVNYCFTIFLPDSFLQLVNHMDFNYHGVIMPFDCSDMLSLCYFSIRHHFLCFLVLFTVS